MRVVQRHGLPARHDSTVWVDDQNFTIWRRGQCADFGIRYHARTTRAPDVFRVAVRLLVAGNTGATIPELIGLLYGHKDDGGPLSADSNVRVFLRIIAERFAPLGITVQRAGINRRVAVPMEERKVAA
jgi:hypothetical protein